MKLIEKGFIIAALFVAALTTQAATVDQISSDMAATKATASDQSGTVFGLFTGSTNGTLASLEKGVGDGIAFIEGVSNGYARVGIEGGYLQTKSQGSGAFANVYFPLSGTNQVFGAGFGVAYLNHNWYDGTVNARLGDQVNVFGLQKFLPLYAYIESGMGYNFATRQAVAQAFAGASLHYSLYRTHAGNTFDVTAGYAQGTISDIRGNVWSAGGSIAFTW